ncbi:MAG: hypothetical protein ACOVS5_05320 [Oligoflexus sp.]|jgi:hypothetical protein
MAKSKKSATPKVSAKTKGRASKTAVKAKVSKSTGKSATPTLKAARPSVNTGTVVEYKLFVEDSVRNLEDQVNYHIRKGWAPVGGVVVQGAGNYMQTMVRTQS